ncbi:MAG: stage 0 sporulation family protein [Gracilibacteraceae bacterium]|jgi:cell fate regulator YaaT (PSP1 superfamily)|nr:stage 0 sporulation family protein [Gracilibacteraceae bacterium]
MTEVVGVRFRQAGRIYDFATGGLPLETGAAVVVETARGLEYGQVVRGPQAGRNPSAAHHPLREVLRLASEADKAVQEQNLRKEKSAFTICLQKIAAHRLPMKLIKVEYTFDNNKIIFSFSADGRVDFRDLVRDLAAVFRTRIELRQIGVRDEAKILGGIGSCGRELCCSTFLEDFEPVSIRMAKEQNISLNPTKISGICGRLMCCLKFESDAYDCRQCERHKILGDMEAAAPDDLRRLPEETEV